jgi:hypothetical protein
MVQSAPQQLLTPTTPKPQCRLSHKRQPLVKCAPPNSPISIPEWSEGNVDGIVLPPTPASSFSLSYQVDEENGAWATPTKLVKPADFTETTPCRKRKRLVELPTYRSTNLDENKIHLWPLDEPLPEHIADLVKYMGRDRDSPGSSQHQKNWEPVLNNLWMGTGEDKVEDFAKEKIFPDCKSPDSLHRMSRQPMAKRAVPNPSKKYRVSIPYPDLCYGYHLRAFPQHKAQLNDMGDEMLAGSQHHSVLYPFLVAELKGDGGKFAVATNQCIGGAATCVNVAETLNGRLKDLKLPTINSAAFSIAMNGSEVRLHVSWKDEAKDCCYLAKVDDFLLSKERGTICKYVRNILDWGRDKRLNEIRTSLDRLAESNKRDSRPARSRRVTV